MPLIPALGRQRQANFCVQGQPGLQSEIQDNQATQRNSIFKKKKKKQKQKQQKKKKKERKKERKKEKKEKKRKCYQK